MSQHKTQKNSHYYVPGYGSLADFIASDDDNSTAIYKRFDKLAARNLLYYQSELASLEALQDQYDIEDAKGLEDAQQPDLWYDIRRYAQEWEAFRDPASIKSANGAPATTPSPNQERWKKRRELSIRIKDTLKEYREALIQESTLLALRKPSKQEWGAFANVFHDRKDAKSGVSSAQFSSMLKGASESLYPPGLSDARLRASDYVSLSTGGESDPLAHFLKTRCSWFFRTEALPILPQYDRSTSISHLPRYQVQHYPLQRVRFVASFITTLTAALLLFLPIYTLYNTAKGRPKLTLGLIALFTILFAGAIVLMTRARRAEIFGACAAYAAVLVVFVSGDFIAGG